MSYPHVLSLPYLGITYQIFVQNNLFNSVIIYYVRIILSELMYCSKIRIKSRSSCKIFLYLNFETSFLKLEFWIILNKNLI